MDKTVEIFQTARTSTEAQYHGGVVMVVTLVP